MMQIGGVSLLLLAVGSATAAPSRRPAAPAIEWQATPPPATPRDLLQERAGAPPAAVLPAAPGLTADPFATPPVDAQMDAKLREEVALAGDLLRLEQGCGATVPVRFRLADAIWELSKRAFFRANDAGLTEALRQAALAEQKSLQERALVVYGQIVATCPGTPELPKILFSYGRALREAGRQAEAAQQFDRIVRSRDGAAYAAQAHFLLGEMAFERRDALRTALREYQAAAQPRSLPHGFALYKQGWCYINFGQWFKAQRCLRDAIAVSYDAAEPLDARVRTALRTEALKDYVRVYAHTGSVAAAPGDFASLTPAAAEQRAMLEGLLDWYVHQGDHRKVIALCGLLQQSAPQSPRQALYQSRIVAATAALGDLDRTVAAVLRLPALLGSGPQAPSSDDLQASASLAESTLRRLAIDLHQQARRLHGTAQRRYLQVAGQLYRTYLQIFAAPRADGVDAAIYRPFMQFYLADVLRALGQMRAAAAAFEAVDALAPQPSAAQRPVVDAAIEGAVRAYDGLVDEAERQAPSASASAADGNACQPLGADAQHFIAAGERYLSRFGDATDTAAAVRFKMARLVYAANCFGEAAVSFARLVHDHPSAPVACFAANLELDIYNGRKDYVRLRDTAHAYARNGHLACSAADLARFATIEQEAGFAIITENLEGKQQYFAAGDADLDFFERYPNSTLAPTALHNAAVNFERAKSPERATAMRRLLLQKYPRPPLQQQTLPELAEGYERALDFEQAANAWATFAERFPHDKRSHDALYNATYYRVALHGAARAAPAWQQFLARYPKDATAAQWQRNACEATSTGGSAAKVQAAACLRRFVAQYGAQHGEAACAAQAKRAALLDAANQPGQAQAVRHALLRQYPPQHRQALRRRPACAAAVAEARLVQLADDQRAFKKMALAPVDPTPAGKRLFERSRRRMVEAGDTLVRGLRQVVDLGVASTTAEALWRIGEIYRASADALVHAPIVGRLQGYTLKASDKEQLRQQLRQLAEPMVQQADAALMLCFEGAQAQGRYAEWPRRAMAAARALRPAVHPPVDERWIALPQQAPLRLPRDAWLALDANRPGVGGDRVVQVDSVAAGDVSELQAAFDAALQKDPQAVAARLGRARLLLVSEPSAALAQCRFVLARAPQRAEAYGIAAQAALMQHRVGLATLIAERGARLGVADGELRVAQAELVRHQGDLAAYVAALQAVVEADPQRPEVLGHLANLAQQYHDVPTSMAALQRLLVLQPQDRAAHNDLATLLRQRGDYPAAEAHYRAALAASPTGLDDPQVLGNLGILLVDHLHRDAEGAATLQRAIAASGTPAPAELTARLEAVEQRLAPAAAQDGNLLRRDAGPAPAPAPADPSGVH